MSAPLENFETWLRIWLAENLNSSVGRPDTAWVRLRADELVEDATHAGFYKELVEAAHPYGDVEGLVRVKLEETSRRTQAPGAI
jgi:hypothetical protein